MLKNAPIVPYIPARDVARARKFYEGKVNGIATAGGTKAAWFKDTEGNIMAVIERIK